MIRTALLAFTFTFTSAFALCLTAPAWAQEADLLAIPENLNRTLPPSQGGGGPRPGEEKAAPVLPENVPNYRSD